MSLVDGPPQKGNRIHPYSQNVSEPSVNKEQGPKQGPKTGSIMRRNLFIMIPTTLEFIFIKVKPWVSKST